MVEGNSAEIMFGSGAGTVTGANFLLEGGGYRVLIDCGLLQGVPGADDLNRQDFSYDPRTIDCLFVTHAHIDHIGRIPKLVKEGFRGVIYSTPTTKELAKLMLADSARVMDNNTRQLGTLPLYTPADVSKALSFWQTIPYHKETTIRPNLSVLLKDAGHILGSAMYLFTCKSGNNSKNILFTGDLGNSPSPLLRDTESVENADILVMDSVYGDRNHEDKEVRDEMFKAILEKTIERGGTTIIPAFSLERTQVILYALNELIEAKKIPSVPVFLDSPLAISVTQVYDTISNLYNEEVRADIAGGDHIFNFPKFKATVRVADSRQISKTKGPKIILAGSGMSTAGRVLGHEKEYLPDSKNTLLLLGYQAPGTLGRELAEGMKEVSIGEDKVPVRAEVVSISGFSAHKDSDGLVDFVEKSLPRLKQVFVVMGEPKSSLFLAQRLKDSFDIKVTVPEKGKVYKIPLG